MIASLVAVTLGFSANSATLAAQRRAPTISMAWGAMSPQEFVASEKVMGAYRGDCGKGVFKVSAGYEASIAAIKPKLASATQSHQAQFAYSRVVDSSIGPPCGVAHHQGSGSGTGYSKQNKKTRPPVDLKSSPNYGNCISDECQIG